MQCMCNHHNSYLHWYNTSLVYGVYKPSAYAWNTISLTSKTVLWGKNGKNLLTCEPLCSARLHVKSADQRAPPNLAENVHKTLWQTVNIEQTCWNPLARVLVEACFRLANVFCTFHWYRSSDRKSTDILRSWQSRVWTRHWRTTFLRTDLLSYRDTVRVVGLGRHNRSGTKKTLSVDYRRT